MSPLLVTRVCREDNAEEGPFGGPDWPTDAGANMPAPTVDGIERPFQGLRFGFLSDDGLAYFTERDRRHLRKNGFLVRRFLCPPGTFKTGREQVAFSLEDALVLDREAL